MRKIKFNKLQTRLIFSFVRLFSALLAVTSFYWAFIWEIHVWRKTIMQALLSANLNWVILIFSMMLFLLADFKVSTTYDQRVQQVETTTEKPAKEKKEEKILTPKKEEKSEKLPLY